MERKGGRGGVLEGKEIKPKVEGEASKKKKSKKGKHSRWFALVNPSLSTFFRTCVGEMHVL
jgi:hypothetical protein